MFRVGTSFIFCSINARSSSVTLNLICTVLLRPSIFFAPFHSEGLGHFPTSNFCPTCRNAGGRKYGKGTPFLCLLRNFLPLSLLHGKSDFAKAGQKKNAANCDVSNYFFYEETRELSFPRCFVVGFLNPLCGSG